MFAFGGKSVRMAIEFADAGSRPVKTVPTREREEQQVEIFQGQDAVVGTLTVSPSKRTEHQGIKIELIGQIELFYDRGNHYEFTSLVRELEMPGTLDAEQQYAFDFSGVEKAYESYMGLNVSVRYFVRATVSRGYGSSVVQEQDFWVENLQPVPEINNSIKMEVGIEDCLHIEFEYDKSKYHLRDIVIGKIYFLLVRIKIKHMELCIIKRESAGTGATMYNESETITKFEIMDGAPVRGESIPIRLFLSTFDLTPTYRNINNRFSVKYYLNLVLVDEEDRRYFKQQEVVLYRQ